MRPTKMTLALALALALVGCGAETETQDPIGSKELKSEKSRETPSVATQDLQAQVQGNGELALDLYQELRAKSEGNLFYSPHSISMALAMLHAGARGNTEAQMAQALHYVLPQSQLHPVMNALDQELESRGQNAKAADGKAFRLNIVNAIWGQEGYSFLQSYLDLLAVSYGAGLRLENFRDFPDDSRIDINKWVERNTENRIKDLLKPGTITPATRLVLTNAIYFNAAWAKPFEADATQDEAFQLLNGTQVTAKMMHGATQAGYAEGAGYKAVALPYDGDELSMLVIVPDAGRFQTFEQSLDNATVDAIVKGLDWSGQVTVGLPRFELEDEHRLSEPLIALGMKDAFGNADLSGIDGTKSLVVSDVLHKAFVKVNEEGTEAAAATAVVVAGSAMVENHEVVANRPFIFLIRDHATGAILFVGRVLNPLT